jgi:phage-related protein (TIGR01555 family)
MAGQNSLQGLKRRLDGFLSTITGIGTSRDKKKGLTHVRSARKQKTWFDDFYAEQAMAKRIVNLPPDDGLRKWFNIDHELNPEIQQRLKDLHAKEYLRQAARKDRLHGGSAVYLDILDGRTLDQPLNLNYGGFKVLGLRCIEAEDLWPLSKNAEYSYNADARTAEYFMLYETHGGQVLVHRDRLLVFPGIEISDTYRHENGGWGESTLRDLEEAITAYAVTHGTVPTIVQDFIIGILSLFGLNELIDTDNDTALKARLDAAMVGESFVNKLVIDSQDSYSREVANVSGLDTLIRHPERRLCAESGIPHTKLLMESAGASLGEGGKNQKSDWEETIEAYQQDVLLGPIDKLVKYIGLELKSREPLRVIFNPLRVMSEAEQAALRKLNAETDAIYLANNILVEEEVRESRFKGEYSSNITLIDEAYQDYQEMAQATAEALNNAKPEPEAPPVAEIQSEADQ